MMDWQDVIAKAPTGTGKTFAYGIPIVEHIDPADESVQAVILAPTRELAIQITVTWPWCRSTMLLTIASPNPVPPVARDRDASAR